MHDSGIEGVDGKGIRKEHYIKFLSFYAALAFVVVAPTASRVDGPPSQWESSPASVTRHAPPRPLVRLVLALHLLTLLSPI